MTRIDHFGHFWCSLFSLEKIAMVTFVGYAVIFYLFLFQISKSKCDILDVIRQKRKKYQGSKWDIMFSNQLVTQIRTYNYGFRKVTLFGYSWVYDNSDRSSMNVKTCIFLNDDCRIQRNTYLLFFSTRVYP